MFANFMFLVVLIHLIILPLSVAAIPAVYQSMPGMLQPFPPYLCMGLNAINASAGPMSHFSDIRQSSSEEVRVSFVFFKQKDDPKLIKFRFICRPQ